MGFRLAFLVAFGLLSLPIASHAQDPMPLIAEGRFDEAVALVGDPGPERAVEVGRAIFRQAYQEGQQTRDYGYAIRGLSAAKRLPGLGESFHHQLDFWHGFALMQQAAEIQDGNTVETANRTLPMFQEAYNLLDGTGLYASTVNVSVDQLLDNVSTYIEIQQAIIRRGR